MTCPACQSQNNHLWIRGQDRLRNKPPVGHGYYRCHNCDLVFLSPQTTSYAYEGQYDASYISHKQTRPVLRPVSLRSLQLMHIREYIWKDVFDRPVHQRLSRIQCCVSRILHVTSLFRHTPLKYPGHGKRLLDVGSGAGSFLLQQQHLGWNVHGLEPSATMVEQCRGWGLDVRQGFSIDEHWHKPTFDVIVLNQVFEHLTDPHTLLVQAYGALNPDGVLYLNMPNVRSLPAQLFRSFWFNLDAPRHNLLFSQTTLKALLKNEGFSVIDMYTASSTKGWSGSIEYLVRDVLHLKLPTGVIRKNRWINIALTPVVRITDWISLGDTVHVIAKKQSLQTSAKVSL